MTFKCQCTMRGFCQNHKVEKSSREFAICQGTAEGCSDKVRQSYINKWESKTVQPTSLVAESAGTTQQRHATRTCTKRGKEGAPVKCPSCSGSVFIKTFECSQHGRCHMANKAIAGVRPCIGCEDAVPSEPLMVTPRTLRNPFAYTKTANSPAFVTTAQLMADAKILASKLPSDVTTIIGMARSGLCVATMVSMLLHRPLMILRQSMGDVMPAGNGWRLTGNTGGTGKAVLIDDTVMSGNSFKNTKHMIDPKIPNLIRAAVYVNPAAKYKPDIWVRDLPWPHLLEWNLFNSIMVPAMATDFDGIICHDCRPDQDDDGPKYLDWMRNVQPLYLTRRLSIPLIVTARLEKYRQETHDWLNRWGVSVSRLVMWPGESLAERNRSDVASWKAGHYRQFATQRQRVGPPMFVESDPRQAQRIAQVSGQLVVCPAAGCCF